MKRDLDLMRDLLLKVEEATIGDVERNPWQVFSSSGTPSQVVIYHVRLLLERKLLHSQSINLEGQNQDGTPTAKFLPDALTDEGHEFLETIRDPEVWRKTKEGTYKIGSFGIDVIKDLAKGFLKTEIKKLTGLEVGD
jgi:hypothetical protein